MTEHCPPTTGGCRDGREHMSMNRTARLVLLVGACAALGTMAIAQTPTSAPAGAWFGVALPPGLGDPHRPILDVSSLKPAAATVPAGEEKNRELEGPAIRRYLEAIVGFSKADRARREGLGTHHGIPRRGPDTPVGLGAVQGGGPERR